jgi:lipoprotein-anchoring transpeptidase ErfK/SrfK
MIRGVFRHLFVIVAVIGLILAGSAPAGAQSATYVVRRGDTLSAIALRYDTSVIAIMRANKLKTARSLMAGQRLIIPGVTAAPAKPAVNNTGTGVVAGALPAGVPARGKAIFVSIRQQRMYVYNAGKLVHKWPVSTGLPGRNTARGSFKIQSKYDEAWSSIWQLRMPYWLGIYDVGTYENGIHALPINRRGQKLWAGLLGSPASFGCVILSTENAATLYNWAAVGTPVIIRY